MTVIGKYRKLRSMLWTFDVVRQICQNRQLLPPWQHLTRLKEVPRSFYTLQSNSEAMFHLNRYWMIVREAIVLVTWTFTRVGGQIWTVKRAKIWPWLLTVMTSGTIYRKTWPVLGTVSNTAPITAEWRQTVNTVKSQPYLQPSWVCLPCVGPSPYCVMTLCHLLDWRTHRCVNKYLVDIVSHRVEVVGWNWLC